MRFPQMGDRQSNGQLNGFSPGSHTRLPQKIPQSRGHVCVSPGSHRPLPQIKPQSVGHVIGSPGSQTPLPQNGNRQSEGQLKGVSNVWQMPSPHRPPPQSKGQVMGSLLSQIRLPQMG
jgi:hypothetical protein